MKIRRFLPIAITPVIAIGPVLTSCKDDKTLLVINKWDSELKGGGLVSSTHDFVVDKWYTFKFTFEQCPWDNIAPAHIDLIGDDYYLMYIHYGTMSLDTGEETIEFKAGDKDDGNTDFRFKKFHLDIFNTETTQRITKSSTLIVKVKFTRVTGKPYRVIYDQEPTPENL